MKTFFTFGVILLSFFVKAQQENSQWRFANNCGLSFTTNPPALVSSNSSGGGGSSSSIADAAGNLLFYTNGNDVRNRLNQSMAGMNTPLQGGGTTQGVLIVKQPGNSNLYYIFVAGVTGLRYSIVDMSLASGNGSVTIKNVTLTTQAQAYKIAGTKHCNKNDVWIVSQDDASTTWRAYLLTSAGVSPVVTSNTGHVAVVYAAMKFSPDGSKIASSEWGDGIYLHDFNNSNGAVSGGTVVSGQGFAAWGVEFSPNGRLLYGTRSTASLFQWDLMAGNATAIAASTYTVYPGSGPGPAPQGALQLATDGKIYQAYGNVNYLSVINNPNGVGAACNYAYAGLSLAPTIVSYGLPNQVKPSLPLPGFVASVNTSTCLSMSFALTTTSVGGINSTVPNNLTWLFGDPASGSANSSTLIQASHVYPAPGTYTVKLILPNACGVADTVSQLVNVPNNASTLAFAGNTLLCMGETTTLTVNGAGTYTWNSSLGTSAGSSLVANPPSSMVFTVSSQNGNSCITTSLMSVSVLPPSVFTVSGNSVVCEGSSINLTAGGVSTYTWLGASGPMATTSTINLNPPVGISSYTLLGNNPSLTCVGQLPLSITVTPKPVLAVVGPTLVCLGDVVGYLATGASNYTWTSAAGSFTGNVFSTAVQGPLSYTIQGNNATQPDCAGSLVLNVTVNLCVGLNENHQDGIRMFPNPCSDKLEIESVEAFDLRVLDVQGKVVMTGFAEAGITRFDVKDLNPSIYVVELRKKDGVFYQKLMKISKD